jgi:hypothetical protein
MKQSAKLGAGALSQAWWAAERNVDGICQTDAAVILGIMPACIGVWEGGAWAKATVETNRQAIRAARFILGGSSGVTV